MNASTTAPQTRPGLTLALLALAQFIIAVDFDIVFVALPEIQRDLGFSDQSLQWVISAYTVALGGFLLLGGRAADRLGARRTFIVGLALFGVASLCGGLASDPGVLVSSRAAQGLGGAMLTPATLKLIGLNFAEGPERIRAMAVWGIAGSSGAAVGALGGGVLTNYLGWEWVLWVNVPVAALGLVAVPRLLRADERPTTGVGGFDLPGAVVATLGSTLVVFGLVSGPDEGWGSLRGGGALVVGLALLGVFLLIESRSRDALVPLRMFHNRSLPTAMILVFIFMSTISTQYYLFTDYLQNVLDYSALRTGLAFLPLSILSMLGSGKLVPVMLQRWGMRVTLFVGMFGFGVAMALVSIGMSPDGSYWAVFPGVCLWALSAGIAFPPIYMAASSETPPAEHGVASALASTSQYIGGAVGLAALVAVANAGIGGDSESAPVSDVVDGLQLAGWTGAVAAAAGAFFAFVIKKPTAPAAEPAEETAPVAKDPAAKDEAARTL
ncbi:MFS transporter [Streptomyces radicis]|uniref:MFS transporter n=1 Tax=Streptomyces radicis TaxID=1750517 RepID=UPI001C7D13EB|nr:MFS transporter [Streptomyces radicis]